MNIAGKKAIIFGGTSGIGLSTTKLLQESGASVCAISRNPDSSKLPKGVETRSCDVRDEAALEALFDDIGAIDILISSATGGKRAIGPFLEMDMEGYRASFDKLWGYTNVVRYGAPHLSENGAIVLVSGAPARKMKPGQIALSSVGCAVEGFARSVAAELAPRRINVVSPGQIDTPIVGFQGEERADFFRKMTKGQPIPRVGEPDEVAQAILFLVQNDYVTGSTIDVDGGWTIS